MNTDPTRTATTIQTSSSLWRILITLQVIALINGGLDAQNVSTSAPAAQTRPADRGLVPPVVGTVHFDGQADFDSDSIANHDVHHWRWLSIPNSRIVLNPADEGTFVNPPDNPEAPLHIGFYAGKKPSRLMELVRLQILSGGTDRDALKPENYETAWYPYQLTFDVNYPQSGIHMHGKDFFHDEHTVVRLLKITPSQAKRILAGTLHITGRSPGLSRTAGADRHVVQFADDEYECAIGLFRPQGDALAAVPVRITPDCGMDLWRAAIPLLPEPQHLAIVVAMATRQEGSQKALERIKAITKIDGIAGSLARRKAFWDDCLKHAPSPEKFGVDAVDPMGITPEMHRKNYFAAWTFIVSNVLPPMPENNYPHAQTPAGKPSLWNFGASKATASAAWESFFAQQLLAYVMPDTAWDAFEGIMIQVNTKGWLDGECLPSRKAQTAWILFSLTGDRERLAKVYPPIRRYLLWREQNPRWIHHGHDIADEKDSSFVDHLLVDMDFAIRIAKSLQLADDAKMWNEHRTATIENYRKWFFFEDGRHPMECYFTKTGKHSAGNPNWIYSGMHIRDLPDDLFQTLLKYYLKMHNPKDDFCGIPWTKYATDAFIVYGLLEHGRTQEARELKNALLRDQMRAGEFAEQYERRKPPESPVVPGGVRPSLFGVAQMIDFTCINNGVRLDEGSPKPITGSAAK